MAGLRRGMWIIRNMSNQAELDSYPVARELTRIYLMLRDPNVGGQCDDSTCSPWLLVSL